MPLCGDDEGGWCSERRSYCQECGPKEAVITQLQNEVDRLRRVVADLAPPLEAPARPPPTLCFAHLGEAKDENSQCTRALGHIGDHETTDGQRWWNRRNASRGGRW